MANKKNTLRLLGDEIRMQRLKLRMSQSTLAAKAGISLSFLGQIERGQKNFSILTFEALASTLRVTMAELHAAVDQRR